MTSNGRVRPVAEVPAQKLKGKFCDPERTFIRYRHAPPCDGQPTIVGTGFVAGSLHQPRFTEAKGELLGIRGVPERQATDMLDGGVPWIDLLELAPNLAGLVQFAQMAQR